MTKVAWGKGTYGMMRYMERIAAGHYQLKWQGDVVDIKKLVCVKRPIWDVDVNGNAVKCFKSLDAALNWVDNVWGNEPVETSNLLNPKAGKLQISRKNRGGCCDPGTETYWSM